MMTQSVVSLAIRYASRSRHMLLAQRLNELALEKASHLQEEAESEEEEVYHNQAQNARCFANEDLFVVVVVVVCVFYCPPLIGSQG